MITYEDLRQKGFTPEECDYILSIVKQEINEAYERSQANREIRWTDKLSLDNDGNVRDFSGNIVGHLKGDTE